MNNKVFFTAMNNKVSRIHVRLDAILLMNDLRILGKLVLEQEEMSMAMLGLSGSFSTLRPSSLVVPIILLYFTLQYNYNTHLYFLSYIYKT
jgi:hypothetical protein